MHRLSHIRPYVLMSALIIVAYSMLAQTNAAATRPPRRQAFSATVAHDFDPSLGSWNIT